MCWVHLANAQQGVSEMLTGHFLAVTQHLELTRQVLVTDGSASPADLAITMALEAIPVVHTVTGYLTVSSFLIIMAKYATQKGPSLPFVSTCHIPVQQCPLPLQNFLRETGRALDMLGSCILSFPHFVYSK
jgi:hypothetical protein